MQTQAQTIAPLYSCPAYDVIEGPREKYALAPVLVLQDGDEVACKVQYADLYQHFKIGSVVSYALRSGECPIKALGRANTHAHDLHFIYGLGTCITAHRQARKTYIGVEIGQRVRFEGRYFEIVKTGYCHLGFKALEA